MSTRWEPPRQSTTKSGSPVRPQPRSCPPLSPCMKSAAAVWCRQGVGAAYCSSLTCSPQVTGLPDSSFCCMAMWAMKRLGVAPCQWFSPGSKKTRSPGRMTSIGPPSRWQRPTPFGDEDRLAVRVGVPGGARAGREVHECGGERGGAGGRGDGVDVDVAGEPVGRALLGVDAAAGDLHERSFGSSVAAGWAGGPARRSWCRRG